MRVGIYDPYLDDVGGGEKYMMTLAECLSKEHDVTVFWDDKNDLENVKERFSLNLDTVSLTKNIFAHGVSFITKLQETKKYDAIIFLSDGSIPVVFSKKLFIHVQQPFRSIKRSSLKDKAKFARITQIFFNSQFTADFTKPYLGKVNTTVIYPPVSLQVKEVKKENSILHVGRFRVQDALTGVTDFKKQSVMITAFKNIIDKTMIKDWKFIIAASVQKMMKKNSKCLRKVRKDIQ